MLMRSTLKRVQRELALIRVLIAQKEGSMISNAIEYTKQMRLDLAASENFFLFVSYCSTGAQDVPITP